MAGDNQLPVHVVKAQDTACRPRQPRRSYSTKVANKPASASFTRACFCCGSQKHMANSLECPAAKVTCRNCKKKGHFARVCQSKLTQSVKEVDMPEYTPLLVDVTETPAKIQCKVDIQTAKTINTMKLTVDTGPEVSVLPRCIYEEHFREAPLRQSSVRLVTYSKTPINVLGCMEATVRMNGGEGLANFYVVDNETALLGRDLISALRLRIEGNTVHSPIASLSPLQLQ